MSNLPDLNRINEPGIFGRWKGPLHPIRFAFLERDPAMLKKFIDVGADVNIDIGGSTLLHELCATAIDGMYQDDRDDFHPYIVEMIKILVEHGADLHKKSKHGTKPLDVLNAYIYSKKEYFDDMVSLFIPAIPNAADLISYDDNSWHKLENQPPLP